MKNTHDAKFTHSRDPRRYDDIIDLPRPVSKTRRPMSPLNRAAQFSPFAALSGYEDLIAQKRISIQERLSVLEQSPDSDES